MAKAQFTLTAVQFRNFLVQLEQVVLVDRDRAGCSIQGHSVICHFGCSSEIAAVQYIVTTVRLDSSLPRGQRTSRAGVTLYQGVSFTQVLE